MQIWLAIVPALCIVALVCFVRARRRDPGYGRGIAGTIGAYLVGFLLAWLLLNLAFHRLDRVVPSTVGNPLQKLAYYSSEAAGFDLLFIGDSRTFCAMHPDILDPQLGTRSFNLARWAHWFPTQHAQYRDLIPALAPKTTVVWSIGHQNFHSVHDRINHAYPIGLARVPEYVRLGHPPQRLTENLLYYNPLTNILGQLTRLRQVLESRLGQTVWREAPPLPVAGPHADRARALFHHFRGHPLAAQMNVMKDDEGQITSLAVSKANGAYYRVEIDHAFFRRKQIEHAAELAPETLEPGKAFEPGPAYWNQFIAILELFREGNVRLIVNELEEAPHQYPDPEQRAAIRRFMNERVRPEVEGRGFGYIRADLDRLNDADYFDYNHLNSRGIGTYSEMLVELLRPELRLDVDPPAVASGGTPAPAPGD